MASIGVLAGCLGQVNRSPGLALYNSCILFIHARCYIHCHLLMHTASWSEVSMSDCFWRVVQLLSHVQLFVTPWTVALQASLSFTISWSLLKLMSIESMVPSNHLILFHPLLLLPSVFPSIKVFYNVLAVGIKWPKYWSFSFSISPSNEYPGLISFRIDWFDFIAIPGILKSSAAPV